LDSNLLKVFVAVKNTKSISLGAKELGFTQSNVTLRIKQLEKILGHELFHRTNKGVVLTKEGEKFYPYALEIIKKVDEALINMKNTDNLELLRVGSTQTNATIRLTTFINQINEDFPKLDLDFKIDSTTNLVEQLVDYKIDIAFLNGKAKHKDLIELNRFEEEIYFIEPKNKEAQKRILAYKKNCVHCKYLEIYVKENKKDKYKTTIFENYEVILACVKAGFGVTLLSKSIIEKFGYLQDLKLTKVDFDLHTTLVCRRDYKSLIEGYLREIKL